MSADLLMKEDIEFGKRIKIIALCSEVEVLQNLSTTGSYREVYHLHGRSGAFISGIIFKNFGANQVEVEAFTDAPVLVEGIVGEYRGVKQIRIESITPLSDTLDKNDLLAEMVDTEMVSSVNDIIWAHSMYSFSFEHLRPAIGLEESTAGTFIERLLKFLQMGVAHYLELTREYIDNISLLTDYFFKSEGNLMDRLDLIQVKDSHLLRALLFSPKEYPEYEEFVKLHHLIMKPRGCVLEILDNNFGYNSTGGSDIY